MCHQAARLVLEPIFEADFLDVSYGFRPRRKALDALERIRVAFTRGWRGQQGTPAGPLSDW